MDLKFDAADLAASSRVMEKYSFEQDIN
ncbi:hypothetical protein TGAM01_v204973 [Trichoderma gamsii]|uniref:Uncharacterized protein n=1 Tax=Trichoderma gamsii TaxID=398673 RepID=A0A2P4ZP13_9HYPO|nr:hypothetical protein TGAM01_v204973 [Trichoderma gamsii]